ncbi:MAG TPA: flagellar basal body rod protein FlgB [Phycisphaerae bacterium]|nr:flagellar basal body rod protein FlgB [Phycisphaerae bacterium]HRR84981.1 flagellar basal body rod protein FlgB [Phycisphaerae bacterium]
MLFHGAVNSGTVPVLEKVLAYTHARHRMLTENIANIDTPGYKARQLNVRAFQNALKEAIARRPSERGPLSLRGAREFREDASGCLVVTPTEEPAENVLFHDRTNMRIERQMAMLAENTLMHQIASDRLKGRFDQLMTAIRGTVA